MFDVKWLEFVDGVEVQNSGIPEKNQEALLRKESLAGQSDAQKLGGQWGGRDSCLSTQASDTANRDIGITNVPG